jgi:hypothetical protein
LRLWFALLALFGPSALVPEAQARPAVVSVGGSQPEAPQRWARPRDRITQRVEATAPRLAAGSAPTQTRSLYLLNRALLR